MKKTVFTLIAVLVLSTTTSYAQRYGGRRDTRVNSGMQHNNANGNHDNEMHKGNNMHNPGLVNKSNVNHHAPAPVHHAAPAHPTPVHPAPMHHPTPIVHYPAPVHHHAPVIVEPAPHPVHVVHSSITPAGLVAGAVIGTVIGALLCQ